MKWPHSLTKKHVDDDVCATLLLTRGKRKKKKKNKKKQNVVHLFFFFERRWQVVESREFIRDFGDDPFASIASRPFEFLGLEGGGEKENLEEEFETNPSAILKSTDLSDSPEDPPLESCPYIQSQSGLDSSNKKENMEGIDFLVEELSLSMDKSSITSKHGISHFGLLKKSTKRSCYPPIDWNSISSHPFDDDPSPNSSTIRLENRFCLTLLTISKV